MSLPMPGPRPIVLATCTFSPHPLRGPDHREVLLREGAGRGGQLIPAHHCQAIGGR